MARGAGYGLAESRAGGRGGRLSPAEGDSGRGWGGRAAGGGRGFARGLIRICARPARLLGRTAASWLFGDAQAPRLHSCEQDIAGLVHLEHVGVRWPSRLVVLRLGIAPVAPPDAGRRDSSQGEAANRKGEQEEPDEDR